MCGIAGIVSLDRRRAVEAGLVEQMRDALIHRGPDDRGLHVAGPAGLGFRRLAIVDPRPEGNQPHFSADGRYVSVCNGEIFNHRDLRQELEARGHRFVSRCDVEVLPHLYEEYAEGAVDRLNGQFAWALYDRAAHRLLLARDPVGICPLYYTVAEGQLLFASEIKALLAHPHVIRVVDPTGLDQCLTFPGLISPTTMFQGIRSLPAGHLLILEDGRIETRAYWDLDYPEQAAREAPADWEEQLDHCLRQAVARRLEADVEVGFYLSGGLDSSLIAGLIHRLRPAEAWHSFSIVFDDARIDERRYQRMVSDRLGSRHHEIAFAPTDIERRLRAVIRHAESPLRESYDTCSHALAEGVRAAGCKVVLSGEGADELFAGYVGYRLDALRGDRLDEGLLDGDGWAERQLREKLWGDGEFFYERDYHAFHDTLAALYAPDLAARHAEFAATRTAPVPHERLRRRHPIHRRSYVDFKLRIADHLLTDHGDRMTFAHSVEGRYPFLDRDLIDLVRRLPPDLLIGDGREKYPLRTVARRYVPPAIIEREKFAFVAPGSPALLAGGAEWIADLLAPERIRRQGYFNAATVERLRQAYLRPGFSVNQTFDVDLLMVVLTFQIFLEEFDMPARS
ncbi:asparagine synthase (glutamine-hydrolyzing) [Chitinimonas lacunae]|uniref:asparagine synthase (glutamine-hydrolyzing) n=1 Tax=Chitinimonas lacunae TaxID=1963018 RepID=A0ABV8MPX5_9NEIS